MLVLRQNTSAIVRAGPFVATTDGKTPSTAIAIDAITIPPLIFKADSSLGTTCDGNTWGTLLTGGQSYGYYNFVADSSDTEKLGRWMLSIQAASTALPIFVQGMVVSKNTYDSLYGTTLTASLDVLEVDVNAISGDTCDANNFQGWLNNAIGTDSKSLVSADAQDLSGTLKVDVNAINGDTCDASNFQAWLDNTIGTDNKTLISTDASWLTGDASAVIVTTSTSVKANVTEIVGDTCAAQNLSQFTSDVVGTDGKVLISADAQDLSGTLKIDVNAINGDTCDASNLQAWLDNTIGTDNKTLISADAQNLEDTLDVNAGAIAGDTCTANDLLQGSSYLDAAISSRSSDNATVVWATCSDLETCDGAAESLSYKQLAQRTYILLNNQIDVSDAAGNSYLRSMGDSTDIATASITDDGTTTTRSEWDWVSDT